MSVPTDSELNSIIGNIIDSAPAPSESIATAIKDDPKPDLKTPVPTITIGNNAPVIHTDSEGNTYDANKHEWDDKTGKPRVTIDGVFRRKRGRGGAANSAGNNLSAGGIGSGSTAGQYGNSNSGSDGVAAVKVTLDYSATGKMITGMIFGTAEAVMGPDWKPNSGESDQCEQAMIRFCEANQWGDIPPGMALVICFGMYAVPRFTLPSTKERIKQLTAGFRKKK